MRLSGAQCVSRALHVVADLGIADALGELPQSSETLAKATGNDVDALDRVLRLVAGYGVFAIRDNAFAHTPASELLRSDHPHSLRSFVRMMGFPVYWRMWEALDVTIRTGSPRSLAARAAASITCGTGTQVLPQGSWKYLADHPEEARIFDDAVTGVEQRGCGSGRRLEQGTQQCQSAIAARRLGQPGPHAPRYRCQ